MKSKTTIAFQRSALAALFVLIGQAEVRAQEEGWGHLTGRIIVDGAIPEPADLTVGTDDRAWCVNTGETFKDRSLIVSSEGGLEHAYVMMYFARSDRNRPDVHPSYEESKEQTVVLNNENCRFEPRAVFLRTGQTIEFKNSDAIGHNCHVVTFANEENCSLGAGQSVELELDSTDRVPGIVKCDIHPWMESLILVRDEPYAAITDAEGNFRIENIPAGEWSFQFWHKRNGFMRTLQRDGKTFLGRRGEVKVTIEPDGTLDLGELHISIDNLLE
ncbi:MAG: hypothetical protein ACR2NP_10135 [Pirellulaceae bacterium]